MRNKTKVHLTLFVLFFCTVVKAQVISTQVLQARIDIRSVMYLSVTTFGQNLDYNFYTSDDYLNGITKAGVFLVKIKSNQNWRLGVSASRPYFNFNGSTSFVMPASVLQLKHSNATQFAILGVNVVELANGHRGSELRPGNTFLLDMKALPSGPAQGGLYDIDIVFTLSPD